MSFKPLDPFTAPLVIVSNEPALYDRSINQSIDEKLPVVGAHLSISGREAPVVMGNVRVINQPINQSTIDSVTEDSDDPSINQSTNQRTNQSTNQPIFQPTEARLQAERTAHQSINDIIDRLTAKELSQCAPHNSLKKPSNQAINQSINQPICFPLPGHIRDVGDFAVWRLSTAKRGNGINALRDGSNESFWQSDGAQPHTVTLSFAQKMRIQCVSMFIDFKLDESYSPSKISIKAGNNVDELTELGVIECEEVTGWITFQTRQTKEKLPTRSTEKEMEEEENKSINQSINQSINKQPTNTLSPPSFGPHSFFSPALTEQILPSINQSINSSINQSTRDDVEYTYLRCHYLQIAVLASAQSGKDTHLRQLRVFGPVQGNVETNNQSINRQLMITPYQPTFQTPEMLQSMTLR